MDVEFKPPNQENGTKKDEEVVPKEKAPPEPETNGTSKESPKHSAKSKKGSRRSRSRTPQHKPDETKTLQVSLKKINSELNGKDLKENTEETEKPEKIPEEKDKNGEEKLNKSSEAPKKEKQSTKQKDDNIEKGEALTNESPKKSNPKKEKKDKNKKQNTSQSKSEVETESVVEMDPLIISDEPDPELLFDENSDMESGKGSPIISRCVTRRSQTRNIPTPKTPKSVEQEVDSEKNSASEAPADLENGTGKPEQLNITEDSDTVNLSTMVVVGSDATRMDYMESHDSNVTDDSYLNATRERSLGETLRSLSARRPIRPLEDYRRRALRANQEKSDLNLPYHSDHTASGTKRKNRSTTPEDRKKFKSDSPVLNSLFSSPLANLRNKFRSDLPSSTPKLLGYRDGRSELHYNDEQNMVDTGDDEKKSWCTIM